MKLRYQATSAAFESALDHRIEAVVGQVHVQIGPNILEGDQEQRGERLAFRAVYEVNVPSEVAVQFGLYSDSQLPAKELWPGFNQILGPNHLAPWVMFPEPIAGFITECQEEIEGALLNVLNLVRWRLGDHGSQRLPFDMAPTFEYSADGSTWIPLWGTIYFRPRHVPPRWEVPDDIQVFLNAASQQRLEPPLAHDLLREAYENLAANPRSAVLLAMTAAEVGFKQFVTLIHPETWYLLEEVPAPPLVRMILEYLPTLPAVRSFGGEVRPLPETVLQTLRNGTNFRNNVAHSPRLPPDMEGCLDYDSVHELLDAVADLLWLLDYYSGQEWAIRRIRESTLDAMNQEASKPKLRAARAKLLQNVPSALKSSD